MDSTHESNWLGWPLFTVMRDEWGSWCPAAHFLTHQQDSDVIIAALSKLWEWTGTKEGCRYHIYLQLPHPHSPALGTLCPVPLPPPPPSPHHQSHGDLALCAKVQGCHKRHPSMLLASLE